MEFVTLPAIVVICYLIGDAVKVIGKHKFDSYIPIICGICGGILGVVIYATIPGYIAADNWAIAIATGIVSGFAATGVNQMCKQFDEMDFNN